MKLVHNNNEIPLDEKAEIIIEKYSPILNLELKGEYALSFNNAITPELQKAMGFSNLPNIETPITKIPVALFDDNLLFVGDLTTKSANSRNYQQELTATPGNIPLSIWKRKITEIDFGKDTIPTTEVITGIHQLLLENVVGIDAAATRKYAIAELLGNDRTTFKVFLDNAEVFSHTFAYSQSQIPISRDERIEAMIDIFNNALENATPSLSIARSTDELSITVQGNNRAIKATILVLPPSRSTASSFTVTFDFLKIKYQSIGNYFDKSLLASWSKPYLFPPLFAPNLYGDANKLFSGNVNSLNGINYNYNNEEYPLSYSFCPVFQFKYIFEKLFAYMGYSMNPAFFAEDNNEKLYWLTLVCADSQLPNISKQFNIYPNEIIYKDYFPNWTTQELIERFQYWRNVYFDFDVLSKTVNIIRREKPFFEEPKIIESSLNIDDEYSLSAIEDENFQLKYAISDSDDESLKQALFNAVPETQTEGVNWKVIENHFAPLLFSTDFPPTSGRTRGLWSVSPAALRANSPWNWSATPTVSTPTVSNTPRTGILTTYQKGKSTMFGLSTEEAKSRSLFCGVDSQAILAENTLSSGTLFLAGDTGIYQKRWKKYLSLFVNTIEITTKIVLPSINSHQFNFGILFFAHSCYWVAAQLSINTNRKLVNVKLRRIKL